MGNVDTSGEILFLNNSDGLVSEALFMKAVNMMPAVKSSSNMRRLWLGVPMLHALSKLRTTTNR